MRSIIAIINLKGGVGKSVTAVNLACEIPRQRPGTRVLLVDLDKQANATKFFGALDYSQPSAADLLTVPNVDTAAVIQKDPGGWGVDIVPSNMTMLLANRTVLMDCTRRQQDRLAKALAKVRDDYEVCILDCPPDLDMATINALCAATEIIIPVDCDEWALDGLSQIIQQVDEISDSFNPALRVMGTLATKYTKGSYSVEAIKQLRGVALPMFEAVIRYTVKVKEAKAAHKPVTVYAPQSSAAMDYKRLTAEVLSKIGGQG